MNNPKIGQYTPEGTIYPSETLAGSPYSRGELDPPPPIVHGLLPGYFAVGDIFPPRDFDVEAEIGKLCAELTPAPAPVERNKRATSTLEEA